MKITNKITKLSVGKEVWKILAAVMYNRRFRFYGGIGKYAGQAVVALRLSLIWAVSFFSLPTKLTIKELDHE